MKKIILMLSVGLFLYAFTMHVKVSLDSPMELVTEEAMATCTQTAWGYYASFHPCPPGSNCSMVYRCQTGTTGYCMPCLQNFCDGYGGC